MATREFRLFRLPSIDEIFDSVRSTGDNPVTVPIQLVNASKPSSSVERLDVVIRSVSNNKENAMWMFDGHTIDKPRNRGYVTGMFVYPPDKKNTSLVTIESQ